MVQTQSRQQEQQAKRKLKKRITIGVCSIALIAAVGVGGRVAVGYHMYTKDMQLINNSYLNYHDKSLKEHLNVSELNHVPSTYHVVLKKYRGSVKLAYNRIKPLYTTQIKAIAMVNNLYDGKDNYRDTVTVQQLNKLSKMAQSINNQHIQNRLIVKIDQVDLWLTQSQQAYHQIKKIASKDSITLNDYVEAHANLSLIHNKTLKNKSAQLIAQIDNNYHQANKKKEVADKQRSKAAINSAKNSAQVKLPHAPAHVSIDLVSKNEQELTHTLDDENITATNVVYLNYETNEMQMLTKKNGYYRLKHSVTFDTTMNNRINLTFSKSVNTTGGLTDYTVGSTDSALIMDDSDSQHNKFDLADQDSTFNTTAKYVTLTNHDKLLLATNDSKSDYVIITPDNLSETDGSKSDTDDSDGTSNTDSDDSTDSADLNTIQLSKKAYATLAGFVDNNTVIFAKSE